MTSTVDHADVSRPDVTRVSCVDDGRPSASVLGDGQAVGTKERRPAPEAPGGPGLVTSAITRQGDDSGTLFAGLAEALGACWQPQFPSAADVQNAVREFPRLPSWGIGSPLRREAVAHEGPRHRISVAAGCVGIASVDRGRRDRTLERVQVSPPSPDAIRDAFAGITGEEVPARANRSVITEWSAKSRSRMVRTLCELDFTSMFADPSRMPAILTLTYPGDWLPVAPNGAAAKGHLDALIKRYERDWREEFQLVWKFEFQRRGAPHFHLLSTPPHGSVESGQFDAEGNPERINFRAWLSRNWAEVVGHPDSFEFAKHLAAGTGIDYSEGLRASDPKRVAVYFTKHGTFSDKEYQHIVPEEWQAEGHGPGRFWGYRRVRKVTALREIPADVFDALSHVLRKHSRAQRRISTRRITRTRGGTAIPKYPDVIGLAGLAYVRPAKVKRRRLNRRVKLYGRAGAGWTSVNNGPAFARQLSRYLHTCAVP